MPAARRAACWRGSASAASARSTTRCIFAGYRTARCGRRGAAVGGIHRDRRIHRPARDLGDAAHGDLSSRRARRGRGPAGSRVVGQTMTGATPRSHDIAGTGRCAQCGRNSRIMPMNWERISGNWTQWKGRVRERWGKLTDDQLDVIAGRRDQLVRPHPGSLRPLAGRDRTAAPQLGTQSRGRVRRSGSRRSMTTTTRSTAINGQR